MKIKAATFILAGGLLALAANAAVVRQSTGADMVPTGKGYGQPATAGQAGPALSLRATGINYHGGPVMTGVPNVYYIWYGNWSGNTAVDHPHRPDEQPRRQRPTSTSTTTY